MLASQDLCVYPDPIDITAAPAYTPVASMFGMNLTSDENCYISYPIAIAFWDNGTFQTEPGDIVAVLSSDLRSFRGSSYGYTDLFTYSFNFADLPPNHVPVLAYEAGAGCSDDASDGLLVELVSTCATIYEALYAPLLAFPTELINKYPQWATCDFGFAGLFDPPTSLVPVDFLTPPSTAKPTTGASPGWSGDSITPSPTPAPITQAPSPTAGPARSSATAVDSDLGSGGDRGTGPEGNGDLSIDYADPPTNTDPTPATVVTFGKGGGSADSSAPATAVFTLGDSNVVTATSIAGANGFIVVGSQTLTAGQAFTTDGAVLSIVDDGLLLSNEAFESVGAILTVNSDTITALYSVNQGSTVIDVGGLGEIAVGGPAITLPSGIVLSAGSSGSLVIASIGGMTTVSYSIITMPTSTTPKSSPKSSTSSSLPMAPIAMTSTTKKGGSSRAGIGMRVHMVWLLTVLVGILT